MTSSGPAALSTQQWLVKGLFESATAARPAGFFVLNHRRLHGSLTAAEMLTVAEDARLASQWCDTAQDAVSQAMQYVESRQGPGVAVVAEEFLPQAILALKQAQRPGAASVLVVSLGASDRATAAMGFEGFDLAIEPGWVHQVYAGVGSLLALSFETGRSTLLRVSGTLADRWMTLKVAGESRGELIRPGEGGLAGWARTLGWNRVIASPVRDERSPMGILSLGEASGATWRVLQRLGMDGRIAVGMIQAMQPLDMGLIRSLAGRLDQMVVVGGDAAMMDRVRLAVLDSDAGASCRVVRGSVGLDGGAIDLPGLKSHPAMASQVYQERWQRVIEPQLVALSDDAAKSHSPAVMRQPVLPHGSIWRDVLSATGDVRQRLTDSAYMRQIHRREAMSMDCWSDLPERSLMNAPPFDVLNIHPWSSPGWMRPVESRPVVLMLKESSARRRLVQTLDRSQWSGASLVIIVSRDLGSSRRWPVGRKSSGMRLRDWRRLAGRMIEAKAGLKAEVNRIDVQDRDRLVRLLERATTSEGVHIVLVEKSQAVTPPENRDSRLTDEGWRWQVAERVCEHCLECTTRTGDPTLDLVRTPEGLKIQTVGSPQSYDGVFDRLVACPAFEQVRIHRRRVAVPGRRHSGVGAWIDLQADQLPEPARPIHADARQWRGHVAMVSGRGDDRLLEMMAQAGLRMGYQVSIRAYRFSETRAARGSTAASILFSRMTRDPDTSDTPDFRRDLTGSRIPGSVQAHAAKPTTAPTSAHSATNPASRLAPPQNSVDPTIDPAAAHLILATDLNEATRAVTGDGPAPGGYNPQQTFVMSDRSLLPHGSQMLGRSDWTIEPMIQALSRSVPAPQRVMIEATELAGRYLGDRALSTAVMFGAMLQQGLIPLALSHAKQAVEATWPDRAVMAMRAFSLGRFWASGMLRRRERQLSSYWVGDGSSQSLTRLIRRRSVWLKLVSGRHGPRYSQAYRQQAERLFDRMYTLWTPESLLSTSLRRLADCVRWGGPAYAAAYADAVLAMFERDDPKFGLALTQAVAVNLARVMLIKDEIYVTQLLTDPAKHRRDDRRWRVDRQAGETLSYHRITRPELSLFGRRYVFEWRTPRWQLRQVARMRWLRRVLPWWHHREVAYRQWYMAMLDEAHWQDHATYRRWVTVMSLPSVTTGFRDVLWRKMDWARRQADHWLSQDISQFKEPGWVGQVQPMVTLNISVLSSKGQDESPGRTSSKDQPS